MPGFQKINRLRMFRKKGLETMVKNEKRKKEEKWHLVIAQRIVHAIVGLVSFFCVAMPAVLLIKALDWIESIGVDGFDLVVMRLLAHALLLFDVYCVLLYIAAKVFLDNKEEGH
ncbi:hypothetical protein [Massilia sp. erpn]|uniref:hypothetical protein n=1 Tax=Massilia sp. erpn TaxID=2738142 RepID=UPI0021041DAA|nr:hypothetical protein [Massilia sp. erpn]UTY55880.1 hypothetical protein HPQ68_00965 [Massilia sp. erpn]